MCGAGVRGDPARLYYARSVGLKSTHFLGCEFSRAATNHTCTGRAWRGARSG